MIEPPVMLSYHHLQSLMFPRVQWNDETICCSSCSANITPQASAEILRHAAGPIIVCFFIAVIVVWLFSRISAAVKRWDSSERGFLHRDPWPLIHTAMILGIGIGGMIDGILLHELLQWHSMISAKVPPLTAENKSVNMFWDGVFHAFMLIIIIVGVVSLYRIVETKIAVLSARLLVGGALMGWGLFNVVEGLIDHHILNLHNVREFSLNPAAWNIGFLLISVLMFVSGQVICRTVPRQLAIK